MLITGAAGFLGSHLALAFAEKGATVIAVSSKARHRVHPAISWERLNLELPSACSEALTLMDRADYCCFLAARKPQPGEDKDVRGPNQRIDALTSKVFAASRCPSAVYVSGLSIFGGSVAGEVTERSRPHPATPYTISKLSGERLFQRASEGAGKQWKILRINAPYGPGMPAHAVVHTFLANALAGKDLLVHGDGTRQQQFTWVGDFCEAVALLMTQKNGIYHFCGPERVSLHSLAEQCLRAAGSSSRIRYAGPALAESCAVFGDDALGAAWPREKRTCLETGLGQMAWALREGITPLRRICR